jgi:hypothetical protein
MVNRQQEAVGVGGWGIGNRRRWRERIGIRVWRGRAGHAGRSHRQPGDVRHGHVARHVYPSVRADLLDEAHE